MDWLLVGLAIAAAIVSAKTQQVAVTVGCYFGLLVAIVSRNGGLSPIEPAASAMVALAVAATMPSRMGRFWLGIAVTGMILPTTGTAGVLGLVLIALGLLGILLGGSELDGRIPAGRFATVLAIWVASLVLVDIVLPSPALGGPIDALAASRARLPMVAAVFCGLSCWPVHTILLDACKRCAMGAAAVMPLLGLATLSRLDFASAIRPDVVGETSILFIIVGLFTLAVGGFLSLSHEDMRFRLIGAQIGLAAWAAVVWTESPTEARVLWATAAAASAVVGAVLNRLEARYRTRERNAFSGLALRHPTTAVTIGFAGIVVAKVAVGPVAMNYALPTLGAFEPIAVVVVLLAGLIYAAAFGDLLRELLFGVPRVPEFRGEIFSQVGKIGQDRGPLVGPTTLFAWGIPLIFVIVLSVAPGPAIEALDQAGMAGSDSERPTLIDAGP